MHDDQELSNELNNEKDSTSSNKGVVGPCYFQFKDDEFRLPNEVAYYNRRVIATMALNFLLVVASRWVLVSLITKVKIKVMVKRSLLI